LHERNERDGNHEIQFSCSSEFQFLATVHSQWVVFTSAIRRTEKMKSFASVFELSNGKIFLSNQPAFEIATDPQSSISAFPSRAREKGFDSSSEWMLPA